MWSPLTGRDRPAKFTVRKFGVMTFIRIGVGVAALFAGSLALGAAQYQGWLIPDGARDE
jgi:hypothetical protein